MRPWPGVLSAAALLAGCATRPLPLLGAEPQAACTALQGVTVAAAQINWPGLASGPATVDSARWRPAAPLAVAARAPTPAAAITPAVPAHCQLVGRIAALDARADPIRFQINLPAAWNGRSLQFGGGGFNGALISGLALVPGARYDAPGPLAEGYATVGTDSGHENRPGVSPMAFALVDEMLVNFAHAAYPKVRNLSVALMRRAYGRVPEKMYFVGSSEGGREGLLLAQRYPAAFDGIFARVPVIHWTGLQFAGVRNGATTFGEGWLGAAQVRLVHEAVLTACDAADGLADGVVADSEGCKIRFDVARLACASAQAAESCLHPAQVRAVQTLHSPYRFPYALANGLVEYPGCGIGGEDTPGFGSGGATGGWRAWWVGSAPPALPPLPANGIAWSYGSGALQYFVARDAAVDPRNVTPEVYAPRVREVSALMDATTPDLAAFRARGGKLILLEYLSDYAQSPYAGIEYVQAVRRQMGAAAGDFLRLYTAPGVDHVGTGAPALVDMLGALTAWVERGRAPAGLTLAELAPRPPFAVQRTRPLCEWPAWPRYKGSGDVNAAASFDCVSR
jgi:feruloyl esterase